MSNERGRPRSFDTEAALDRALEVFWRHGYQGASLAELTQAMGLNKPSLYSAFGDKEALYLKALDRYGRQRLAAHAARLEQEPDARRGILAFLGAMADMFTDPHLPGGCFIVNGSTGGQQPVSVAEALREGLSDTEALLRRRLQRAQEDGQLPPESDAGAWAALLSSLLAGLAVQARSGAPRAKLHAVLSSAMQAWPEAKAPVPRRSRGA